VGWTPESTIFLRSGGGGGASASAAADADSARRRGWRAARRSGDAAANAEPRDAAAADCAIRSAMSRQRPDGRGMSWGSWVGWEGREVSWVRRESSPTRCALQAGASGCIGGFATSR